jgi:hypothetical protein
MLKTFTDMSKENREEVLRNTTRQEKEKIIKVLKLDLRLTIEGKDDILHTISDFDKKIKNDLVELEKNYANTIRKYHFPIKRLREMIYPEFIENASFEIK